VRWNAVDAYLDLDDSVVYFGEVEIGKGSDSPISRTVENHTPAPLSITVTKRAGPGPSCSGPIASEACRGEMRKIADSFDVNIDDCRQIPAFGSCELTVQFTPQAAFPMDASFTLHEADNREVRDRTVSLKGIGVMPRSSAGTILATEYVNADLGHYFLTAVAAEKALLDPHHFSCWTRTGRSFRVYPAMSTSTVFDLGPVCRFYGLPDAGIDSHFFSAAVDECNAVTIRFPHAWVLESSDVFRVVLPTLVGACPGGWLPVYRVYDNRADANHRYLTDRIERDGMLLQGWIKEGYGTDAVAMCVPR